MRAIAWASVICRLDVDFERVTRRFHAANRLGCAADCDRVAGGDPGHLRSDGTVQVELRVLDHHVVIGDDVEVRDLFAADAKHGRLS
jgi:hypothetical protein